MAEELRIKNGDKQEMYETLLPQIASLVGNETDLIANMANIAAALKQTFGFFWVGFYRVIDNQLVLAPFQGPIACTRIKYGKGVCGTAWKEARTIIVPDVDAFLSMRQGVMPRRLYMLTQRQELRPRIAGTLNSMENAIDGTLILPVID